MTQDGFPADVHTYAAGASGIGHMWQYALRLWEAMQSESIPANVTARTFHSICLGKKYRC